jgi:hypothetical protein
MKHKTWNMVSTSSNKGTSTRGQHSNRSKDRGTPQNRWLLPKTSLMKRAPYASIALLLLLASSMRSAPTERVFVLDEFLRESAKLNAGQIDSVHRGKAVATILESPTPDEVFVFGTVYIEATPESYLQLANDFDALRKLPSYLAIQKFSNPPQPSDLTGFTIDEKDLKELKNCKPGDCEVQLPSEAMDQFQKSVNWKAADAASQANRLAQQMALEALVAYQKGGNEALGVYRDKNHPTKVAETFQSLLGRLKSLPVYLPDVNRVLLEYPGLELANAHYEFYWEKVNFGLKPTLRMVQQITYRGGNPGNPAYAVALKQLYSSHYFQSALDLTVCIRDAARPNEHGFYLITVKASQQAGLTGLKGSIVRKVAVGRTRSSLERTLTAIKERLEAAPG